ncbi:TetR family transcriptional regulator C-terminal domain-containing protein [Streptomyces sp. NRRL F-5126]|uniref:TetR family transcriptional regulator C-terminal domain-containing protein n=1 Tax=Streptomyces sp. NRRL F-5126 TaxID=1463857 RepID=UPI00131D536A|nr:TetR family transcriptional regulator C-terminal domain-containing protein [Streptomyces sp. NRRL F-5126]
MARPRGDDVRRQIILATFRCVAREGVSGMSLREVARTTGTSTGTITYHFGSRHGLLLDAVEYGYWDLPQELYEMDPAQALRWVLHRYELSDEPRRSWWQFWLAITAHAQVDAEVSERLLAQTDSILVRWRACIERGIAAGQIAPDTDAATEAGRLAAYAHGLAIAQLINPSAAVTKWATEELTRAVEILRDPQGASPGLFAATRPAGD